MARGLYVAVFAETKQFIAGLAGAEKAAKVFATEVSVSSQKVVQAQVAASVKTQQRLREQITLYRQVAAAAEKGSAEQVAATRLAADAQNRLQRELGQTTVALGRTGSAAHSAERGLERAARGALTGSGIFHNFGRSLVFASGGFLAFQGVTEFLRGSVAAAQEAAVAQRSLAAQMRASGESFDANRERIDKVALSYGKFGFQNDDVIKSLTVLDRGTGNINKAIQLQGLTADLARAKNLDLSKAATVVAKVFGGQETALRRAVPGLSKNAHGWDLIREAQQKLRGQAAANTTSAEKFAATLHDTEEIVGTELLPTLNEYLDALGKWLQKMNESGKLQRDVNEIVGVAKDVIDLAAGALRTLNGVTGSTKDTLKLLLGVFAGFKAVRLVAWFSELTGSIGAAGAAAETSAASATVLSGNLAALTAAPYIITIYFAYKDVTDPGSVVDRAKSLFGLIKKGGPVEKALENLPNVGAVVKAIHDATGGPGRQGLKPFTPGPATGPVYGPPAPTRPIIPETIRGTARIGPTVEQRNAAFDAAINRQLGRVQDIATVGGQIARLRQLAGLVQRRLNATKDITRRLRLEDDLVGIFREIGSKKKEQQQDVIDALSLNIDRAGLTATLTDNIAALQMVNAKLAEQQKQWGYTVARQQQIIANQGQLIGLRQQQQQNVIDALTLNVDRADLTKSQSDNIAALQIVNAKLAEQQQQYGYTIDREKQIIANQNTINGLRQQQADALKQQRQTAKETTQAWFDFALERADDTKTIKDNLKVLRDQEKWQKAIIKQEGRTLENVKALWETRKKIRDLIKGQGDPLAGLVQVSSKGLANILSGGLGLGVAGMHRLEYNIAGAEIQPVHVHVNLDGREVATAVTKHQTRAGRRTAKQTSGFRG